MAGLLFNAGTEGEVALSAATVKTIVRVKAPANQMVKVLAWGVSFDGTVSTNEPVVVQLLRQTTDGTGTSFTAKKVNDSISTSVQSTTHKDFSAEPTAGDILDTKEIHPQSGLHIIFPPGQEPIVGGGGRLAIRATAPNAVNVSGNLFCEE